MKGGMNEKFFYSSSYYGHQGILPDVRLEFHFGQNGHIVPLKFYRILIKLPYFYTNCVMKFSHKILEIKGLFLSIRAA